MIQIIYSEKYMSIIDNAKKRGLTKKSAKEQEIYVELHHIMPKCIAPELKDEKTNLVYLTGQEHFEAHKELALSNPNVSKLVYAWNRICNMTADILNKKDVEITAEDFESCRKLFSTKMTGKNNPSYREDVNKKRSEKLKGRVNEWMLGDKNWCYGKELPCVDAQRKQVICLEHPEIYFCSQIDAEHKAKDLGWTSVNGSHIGAVTRGLRTSCGKDSEGRILHWALA